MKIIREKSSNEIIYAGKALLLTDAGLTGNGFRASNIKPLFFESIEIESIPADFAGRHYVWTASGGWARTATGEAALSERIAAEQAALKDECVKAIVSFIQEKVDAYTKPRGLLLETIKDCKEYKDEAPAVYKHQPFCSAIWAWNVQVWVAAEQVFNRALAGDITITTPSDALALLPEFVFEEIKEKQ